MVRIIFGFDHIPLHTLTTSGQKVEATFLDTYMKAGTPIPGDSESIARILVGEASDRLVLSLLLRRPPKFVNALKREAENEIVLDIHWREQDNGLRPAISRSLPGGLHVGLVGGVSRKAIASKYQGRWENFFLDYERPIDLDIPLQYTLAPFPVVGLYVPAHDEIPLEVLDAAMAERWGAARGAYTGTGFEGLSTREKIIRDLVLTDIYLREDKCTSAFRALERVLLVDVDGTGDSDIDAKRYPELEHCRSLLELYVHSCSFEQPYPLLAELALVVSAHAALAQQPYVTLLQAEAELAAGRDAIALQLLDGLSGAALEPGGVLSRRQADAGFKRGDIETALKIYTVLDETGQLNDYPYSLSLYGRALYENKRYQKAQEVFSRLHDLLEEQELRDMAKYFIARSMLRAENTDSALSLLGNIMPGSYAAQLAKLKLSDLSAAGFDERSREQALLDYTTLLSEMPTRAGRAEVEFKQALTYHLLRRPEQAIAALRHFLNIDRISPLRVYAQALLAEILPTHIDRLVTEQQYFAAMLLVEQNRDILVATQRNYEFLLNLGMVFSELEFHARAIKLYEYVLDATDQAEKLEPVYVPLIKALYGEGDYRSIELYARRYLERFRNNDTWLDERNASFVYLGYAKALLRLEREDEVDALLRKQGRPRGVELDRFAARHLWRKNEIVAAGKQLENIVEAENAELEDIFIYAESLYAQQQLVAAFEYYQRLSVTAEYRLPAMYRMGNILIEQGEPSRGLTFLTQVAESNGDSGWKNLAQQSLLIQKFD